MRLVNGYAKLPVCLGLILGALMAIPSALATPVLQLYIEGAVYDDVTESWVLQVPSDSLGEPFRIWTIGNVDGPGGAGTVFDVRLAAAYDSSFGELGITLTGSQTGGLGVGDFGGFIDPSVSAAASFGAYFDAGVVLPKLGDGSDIAPHGEYGPGITWREADLGDFSLTDSPIADFISAFPDPIFDVDGISGLGQINVYEVTISPETAGDSLSGLSVHFDLFNHIEGKNHIQYKFAPFSHDGTFAPVPAAVWPGLSLFASLGVVGIIRRRFGSKPAAE